MSGLLGISALVIYFCLSFLQFFALMDGFAHWFGTPDFINFFLALFGAGIPFLGTIGGCVGATQVWGWEISQTILLFFGPLGLSIGAVMAASFFDKSN